MGRPSEASLIVMLRDELSMPDGDQDRIRLVVARAQQYVDAAIGNQAERVENEVWADCVTACAADLYNSRNTRFGVLNAGTDGLDAVRISNDPLYSVWPKLRAAGVLTGRQVIA